MVSDPVVLFESYLGGHSFQFVDLCDVICVSELSDVGIAFDRIEAAVDSGLHAAGFVAYEAAAGLDDALTSRDAGDFPLVWFGLFRERQSLDAGSYGIGKDYDLGDWQPSIARSDYDGAIKRIRDYIVAGDTYQVNYSFRLRAGFTGDGLGFYRNLCRAQRTDFAAYLNLGRYEILSASPELFFALKDGVLTARPMKGTARRGRYGVEDQIYKEKLTQSGKDRAENVMIVDLLRNDLGRVSKAGSVTVPALWDVEPYETVLQMTSTVTSRLCPDVNLRQLMASLFPCGSVTGAPKVRTMEIIDEVEDSPRGIYTGSIGYVSPGGEMAFNVAIRTVCIDRETGVAEFGVGGGVTYDSSSDGEYEECVTKARLLTDRRPDFGLFETLRYDDRGFFLLDRHLKRLEGSAQYFGFGFDRKKALGVLEAIRCQMVGGRYRVRLVLARDGDLDVEYFLLKDEPVAREFVTCISEQPIDQNDPLFFHKTTYRNPYTSRLRSDCDEVILVNLSGEVTECSIGNLVAKFNEKYVTPPVHCGLLAGTFRDELLAQGKLEERVLYVDDVKQADALFMINSVREWVKLKLVD